MELIIIQVTDNSNFLILGNYLYTDREAPKLRFVNKPDISNKYIFFR